jgi:Kdo2-lipid IVA lauroyltransferase/acyltransferase
LKTIDKIILLPIWLIAHLPMWVLHSISWVCFFFIFHIAKYRKRVVYTNLRNSFPEKNEQEINKIAKRFYLHLCDIFLESFYALRMKPEEVIKRFTIENREVYDKLYAAGKEIICMTGHYANWEWSGSAWLQMPHHTIGVYKPLTNKMFDRFFIHLRTCFGSDISSIRNAFKSAHNCRKNGNKFAMLLVGDQRPVPHEIKLWINFFNQDTPVILGPEKMAHKFNAAVVFFDVQPVKRGYYKVYPIVLAENSKDTAEFEIIKKFYETLENQVRKRPEYYLWSHKRWKYTREGIAETMEKQRLKKQE